MPNKKKEAPLTLPKAEVVIETNSDNASVTGITHVETGTMSDTVQTVMLDKPITIIEDAKTTGRIIAIVGFAETSRDQVTAEPESTEIWSLNRCYTFLKRNWHRWYEVHEEDLYTGKTGLREKGYLELIQKSEVPIYMQHPNTKEFPMSEQFPLTEINKHFRDYYTSSIAYMLAHAAYEHQVLGQTIKEVHIYGVDMSAFSEYSEQLPCVNYWLGVLEGMLGKDAVVIPSVSPLLKCVMQYGRHNERPLQKMAKERLLHHKEKQAQLTSDLAAVAGISSEYNNFFKFLDELIVEIEKDEKPAIDLVNTVKEACKKRRNEITQYHSQVNADLNAELGGGRETQHWIVALNAAQDADEEPVAAKIPKI